MKKPSLNQETKHPNDGEYTEVGEKSFVTEIQNPKRVTLQKGEAFPETSNHNRKWKKLTKARVH